MRYDFIIVNFLTVFYIVSISVAELSEAARLLGLRVRMPPASWVSLSCEYRVLSCTDL